MLRRISVVNAAFVVCILSTDNVWAAAKDTMAPGSLTTPSVVPGIRGLSLRFGATGDDGAKGKATAYETRVVEGLCAGATWPVAWTTLTNFPQESGKLDAVPFSPLAASQSYCIQIRARDDVNLYSPITQIAGTTLNTVDGNWALTALPGFFANAYIDTAVDTSNDTVMMAVQDRSAAGVTGVKVVRVSPAPVNPNMSFDEYDKVVASTVVAPSENDCLLSDSDCVVQISIEVVMWAPCIPLNAPT